MTLYERAKSFAYGSLQRALAFRERHDFAVTTVEIVATSSALADVILSSDWKWYDFLEAWILLILLVSIFARFALVWRKNRLGYLQISLRAARPNAFNLFAELEKDIEASKNFMGSPVAPGNAVAVCDSIANASASAFSVHSYGRADPRWYSSEKLYLDKWHAQFPYAIWRLPDPKRPNEPTAGYFSVVVPINKDSWEKVSRGHLATALASLDSSVLEYLKNPQGAYQLPLYLLAYAVVYAPGKPNEFTLLRAGIEHVAFLLKMFTHKGELDPKNVHIICESSGREFDQTLHGLGFSWLVPDDKRLRNRLIAWVRSLILKMFEREDVIVVTSPAGFKLFQLNDFTQTGPQRLWKLMNKMV